MKKLYTNSLTATATPAHSHFYSSFMRLPALRVLLILLIMVGMGNVGWGQTTIAQQDFETSPAVPTWTYSSVTGGGTANAASSYTTSGSERPGSTAMFIGGKAYRYTGPLSGTSTSILTFDAADTRGFSSITTSFRVAAFATSSTQGWDASNDFVRIEISPDNGTTWYNQAEVTTVFGTSGGNATWAFTGTGSGSRDYLANNSQSTFSSGAITGGTTNPITYTGTNAITTVTITNLPAVQNLRIRLTLSLNGSTAENTVIDDVKLIGSPAGNTAPTVTTQAVSSIGTTTATGNGNISATGGVNPDTRGVCWVLFSNGTDPTTSNYKVEETGGSFSAGAFTESMTTNLAAETRYKLKAYATNTVGTSYGGLVDFWTLSTEPSAHSTAFGSAAISSTQINLSFDAASTITNAYGYIILQRTGAAPTGSPADATAYSVGNTIGDGTVAAIITSNSATTSNIISLTANTNYYYKIFPYSYDGANAATYNYKTDGSIPGTNGTTLPNIPTITTTNAITAITPNTASSGGTTLNANGGTISVKGVVWNTTTAPVLPGLGSTSDGSGTSNYTSAITGLNPQTLYYVRAYATNEGGTGYGTNVSFRTLSNAPTVQASSLSGTPTAATSINLSWTAATFPVSGATTPGYVLIRATSPALPTLASTNGQAPAAGVGTIVSSTIAGGAVTQTNSSLTANTTYNYLLVPFTWDGTNTATYNYLTTSAPTASATTLPNVPTITTTNAITAITPNTASSGGTTLNANGGNISIKGVVWNTTTSPVLPGLGSTSDGSGTSNYTSSISGLNPGTQYYVRAYATNEGGTGYGSNVSFYTLSTEPTTQPTALAFSNVTATGFTINATAGNGSNRIYVVRQTGAVDFVPTDGIAYTANTTFTSGTGQGPSSDNKVVAVTGTSVTVTGLTANTTYYVAVYEFNGSTSTINYLTTSPLAGSRLTAPTAASAVTVGTRTSTSMDLSWTNGNGTGRIVLARLAGATLVAPTNGTEYAVNSNSYTDALNGTTGTDNIIVFNGTGNSVTVTGLTPGAQYQFYVYGYNGSGASITYAAAALSSATYTLAAEPTTQPTTLAFSNVTATGFTINATAGNGSNRIYVVRQTGAVDFVPVDGTAYTANTTFSSGTGQGPSSDNKVVAVTGTSVTVTGLTANTTYYVAVYEFNGTSSTINYLTTSPLTGSRLTAPTAASAVTVGTRTPTSMDLSWTNGNGTGRIVLARMAGATLVAPTNGTVYAVNSNSYTDALNGTTGTDNIIVYNGTGNSTTVTGLTPGAQYQFYVYGYNGSGASITYAAAALSSATYTLAAEPTVQTSAVTFSSITATGMTVNFTKGDGGYRVVVMKSGSAVNSDPVDGTSYSTAAFGSGTQLGTGNYVVYSGTAGSATVTGLTANTTYYVAVYELNGTGGNSNYLLITPATGNQITLVAVPTAPTALTFNTVTSNSFKASFTAASGSPAGYLVMRKKGSDFTGSPVGGTEYTQGGSIGASVNEIIYIGTSAWTNVDQTGLDDNTIYYYAVYSYTGTGTQINYSTALTGTQTTSVVPAPVAIAATDINSTGFTAKWNASADAASYRLDVSTISNFGLTTKLSENFDLFIAGSIALPDGTDISGTIDTYIPSGGWAGSKIYQAGGVAKISSAAAGGYITTKTVDLSASSGNATLTFDLQLYGTDANNLIQVFHAADGVTFTQVGSDITATSSMVTNSVFITGGTVNSKLKIAAKVVANNRFYLDNLKITQDDVSTMVSGYSNLTVSSTSQSVTGLTPNTLYHYRVRAIGGNSTSANSNTITAITLPPAPTITSFTPNSGCSTGGTVVAISGTDFTGATAVTFNGVNAASYSVTNATTISATTQAAVTTGKISVTTPGGTVNSATDFTVTSPVTPTFTQLGPFCQGATPDALPATSIENVTGTWNPATISTTTDGTTVYTFTPDAGQCATTATMSVNVNAAPTADAGPESALALTNTAYTFPGASASNGTISWSQTLLSGPAGAFSPALPATGVLNPSFTPSSTSASKFTLTVTSTTGCGTASDFITIYVLGTAPVVWSGAISEAWGDYRNWGQLIVPDATTNVLIPAGSTRYPNITTTANCNDIVIESGASLLGNENLTVAGSSTIERTITNAAWHLISVPNNTTTANTFRSDYLQSWAETTATWSDIYTTSTHLNPVQGYGLWNATGGPKTYSFTGAFLYGPQSHAITFTSVPTATNDGANLLGNPYPSYIDWDGLRATYGAVYYWDGTDYVSWNDGGAGAQFVPPSQGFFIITDAGMISNTFGLFSLSNSNRSNQTDKPFYKSATGTSSNRLVLETVGESYSDKLFVTFDPSATEGFDLPKDAYKLLGYTPGVSELYSYTAEKKLSIDVRPECETIPLGFTNTASGEYQIGIQEIADIPVAVLEDTKTNTYQDLLTGPYKFSYTAGESDKRFILHFGTTSVKESEKVPATVYSYQRTVHINMKDQQKGDIFIYTITGQLIKTIPSATGMNEVMLPVTGNYVIKVISKDKTVVRKVWIQ